jgi:hypothetical protein
MSHLLHPQPGEFFEMAIKRRDFIAGSVATAAVAVGAEAEETPTEREYYEVRKISLASKEKRDPFLDFMGSAYIPAANREGAQKVGVFVSYEDIDYDVYTVTPFPSAAAMVNLKGKLLKDKTFQEKGDAFLNAPFADPAYTRMESLLMLAFTHMPKLEAPEKKASRVYEMRIYESHSVLFGQKKIHMFNEGGEIELFRKVGLAPVFFGEALVGPRLPNLTYMVSFEDMEAHAKNWKSFIEHPEWIQLKEDPYYKDTVSNITKVFLKAADCSQI